MIDYDKIVKGKRLISRPIMAQMAPLLLVGLIAGVHMTAMAYLGYNQNHICTMPKREEIIEKCNITWTEQQTRQYIPWNGVTESPDSCTRYAYNSIDCVFWGSNDTQISTNDSAIPIEKCNSWTYDTSVFTTTALGEFDLVCDNKQKGRLSQAIFMMGVTLGHAAWGQISDNFGRKFATITPLLIAVSVGIATGFSNSFTLFVVLRFIIGFTATPSYTSSYVLATELVTGHKKVWISQMYVVAFGLGICTLSGVGYFVRDWRQLQIWISAPGFLLIIWLCFVWESPRWLIAKRRYVKADKIIRKLLTSDAYQHNTEARKLNSLCDKMVTSALYYGLTLNSADLGGSAFLNLFLAGIVEFPAAVLALPMMNSWGRRPTLTSTLILSGIVCICMMFVAKELIWLNVLLSTVGKFSISAAFGTAYVYAAEIYPTPVRNVGLGVCASWARIGGMLAPCIAMLDVIGFAVPYVTFGLLAVLAGLLSLLLPETLNKKTPETLEDAEQFGKQYEGIIAFLCGDNNSTENENSAEQEWKA